MIGTKLAHYEITSHLGSGGMGDVYQATDARLGRQVAIKLLPEAFTHDGDRAARFEREARLLASLNHPNIAAIYGIEQFDERKFLVMELVGGETLAERIKRGTVPVKEALEIARQIAEGLEAAHEKGVIHRDLKPANVKITADGDVKVLDFGLAKAFDSEASQVNLSQSPTLSLAATNAGVILGTAAYMSPEQAKGRPVDRRTDIFAFGCVLYEVLTGRPTFEGEDVQDILGGVLRSEPDWARLPSGTPIAIQRMLRRALKKDPRQRLGDIRDARLEIEEVLTEQPHSALPAALPARKPRMAWMAAATAVLLAAVLAVPAVRYLRQPLSSSPPESRVDIVTPRSTDPVSFAISPDGRQIVFVASGDGPSRLWLRPLVSTSARALAGTEGAVSPFWSPDSRSVGFFAEGKLMQFDIANGVPQTITGSGGRGGTWNAAGVILFTPSTGTPLFRVSASGGEAVPVTKLDGQSSHRFPYFLGDGRQFLFLAQGTPETAGIYLGSLDSTETRRLTPADTAGVYLSSGWLIWVRAGALVAQRLDLESRALTGDPVTLADSVAFDFVSRAAGVSVSATGLVAYREGAATRTQLTWFDRAGKTLGLMGTLPDTSSVRFSPDGRRAAVERRIQGNMDIWTLDGTRSNRFTTDAAPDRSPIWSPDGSQMVFASTREGRSVLYQKSSSGASSEQLMLESPQGMVPNDWSHDGRFILYHSSPPADSLQGGLDLWVLPMEGDRKPAPFLTTDFNERSGQFSPSGRWVAYASNQSGHFEIYTRPFEETALGVSSDRTGEQSLVSTAGGVFPRWRADGKELYYIGSSGQMMAVPVTDKGATLELGTPVALFQTRIVGGGSDTGPAYYDVSRDNRFLITVILDDAAASPITLLQNWSPPAR